MARPGFDCIYGLVRVFDTIRETPNFPVGFAGSHVKHDKTRYLYTISQIGWDRFDAVNTRCNGVSLRATVNEKTCNCRVVSKLLTKSDDHIDSSSEWKRVFKWTD